MVRWVVWMAVAAVGCGKHGPVVSAAESKVYRTPQVEAATPGEGSGPVGEAFAARPAIPLPARIAVFSVDEELAQQVADALPGLQGVSDTYVVRGYLVDGRARWSTPYFYYRTRESVDLDLEKLRSLAAMAHCDALLLVDHAWQEEAVPNGWTVTSPLLLPMLFTPWLNITYRSYLDLHLIDTRTGYLYGEITTDHAKDLGASTIYKLDSWKIVDGQLEILIEESKDQLSDLLWYHLMEPDTRAPRTPTSAMVTP